MISYHIKAVLPEYNRTTAYDAFALNQELYVLGGVYYRYGRPGFNLKTGKRELKVTPISESM